VTQPALSRQIAALEAELGVQLFDRVKQRIQLTEAGRFFLPKARQILCDAETSAQQLKEQFGKARRTLRLGFLSIFSDDLVAPAIREFRQRHPKAQVSLHELAPRAQLERLRAHELDAVILGNMEARDREEFSVTRLSTHAMAAVLPEDHPLAGKKSMKLAALAKEPWVSLSDTAFPGRREFLRAACVKAGFEPRIAAEVDSLSLVVSSVSSGEGVALLPSHAVKLPHHGCVFVALSAPVPLAELLLLMPKARPSAEMATLAALIQDRAAQFTREGPKLRAKLGLA
jgi:DNA-binding transcriptional LysR family regulator